MSDVLLVSHFHWDREWYRAFEVFRGRLIDAIDAVLDQVRDDPGFRFVLDGQAIVLEDYLALRPARRAELVAGLAAGRLSAGPWYVQPDSLLPGGETHVRNLLHGRAVTAELGPVSTVAYVPDSFGHPAQFPQLFAGFGLDPFIYWRGNGSELDRLGPLYRWTAPDGTSVRAWHLPEGYFGAGGLDADGDVDATATRLKVVIDRLVAAGSDPVLLMNGFDHLPADRTTGAIAAAVGAERVLLDDTVARLAPSDALTEFRGELTGARITNLLPGVWSARLPLKLRNRAIETLLTRWAEPWAAFGESFGLASERPALTTAWRTLLCNQAHDSICGCSIDPVHERMVARYDDAEGLGTATVERVLERLAGRDTTRNTPWSENQDIVVFNASTQARTDVVRVPLDAFPPWRASATRFDMHPLMMPSFAGLTIGGQPARVIASDDPNRVRFLPGIGGLDVEFVARDVPAFGCVRLALEPADADPDIVDDGTTIGDEAVRVAASDDGTLVVSLEGRTYPGLFGIEDCIDRGDSYDADCDAPRELDANAVVERTRHASGIERLTVTRELTDIGTLTVTATVAPGVPFVRCDVALDNRATDHRLRLRFPTGSPLTTFTAATTFDVATRSTAPVDDAAWVHPAVATFAQQGFVAANHLVVGAPGLPEAEVTADGDILVTLVRSVGALSRIHLRSRPLPAGPEMLVPGAQVQERISATITLGTEPSDTDAAEVGLVGVIGGPEPLLAAGTSLLEFDAAHCILSACKPAEDGDGIVVRLLNPSDTADDARISFGFEVANVIPVRLDETTIDTSLNHNGVALDGRVVSLSVPPHALRSVRVQTLRR